MELTEELESLVVSDSVRRRTIRTKSSFTLALMGWLIIGSALNTIIFSSFPLRLAAVDWQLNLIGSILSSTFTVLVGSTLIIVAQLFNTKERKLQKWQYMISRFASWLAVLLILIIPVQFFIGAIALRNQAIPATEAIKKLKVIVNEISEVSSEADLRSYVASLPNPPALPPQFDAPFPIIKQRVITNINAQINAATNALDMRKSQALQIFLKEAVRNTSQAILMATAFSILANLSSRATNAISRFIYSLI